LFFFQAEDGIRVRNVTGVQTCALPISFLKGEGFFNMLFFLNITSPSVGSIKVDNMEMVVDLPAPFGPNKPIISPFSIYMFILLNAYLSLYLLDKSINSSIFKPPLYLTLYMLPPLFPTA